MEGVHVFLHVILCWQALLCSPRICSSSRPTGLCITHDLVRRFQDMRSSPTSKPCMHKNCSCRHRTVQHFIICSVVDTSAWHDIDMHSLLHVYDSLSKVALLGTFRASIRAVCSSLQRVFVAGSMGICRPLCHTKLHRVFEHG